MKKEKQIQKWLNGSLTGHSLEDFKQSEEYKQLLHIDKLAQHFKAPDFDEASSLASVQSTIASKAPSSLSKFLYPWIAVAAVLLVGLLISYQWFSDRTVTIQTYSLQEEMVTLPDNSTVQLNANSVLTYTEKNFTENRHIKLEGEAFIHVEKGAAFTVQTPHAQVQVLGTSFNVKSRKNFAEVECYSGKVKVQDIHDNSTILTTNQRFASHGHKFSTNTFSTKNPSWLGNQKSSFYHTPLYIVLEELALQYKLRINTDTIDTSTLFTGSFSHKNLENALEAITLPTQLSYTINDNEVTLQKR